MTLNARITQRLAESADSRVEKIAGALYGAPPRKSSQILVAAVGERRRQFYATVDGKDLSEAAHSPALH